MVAAGDKEAQGGVRELHLGRGQRSRGGVAAQAGADERVTPIITELTIDAIDLARDRRETEASAGGLPAIEAVALEGFNDLGLGLKGDNAEAKGERGEEGGLHGGNRGTAQKRGCSLQVERGFQKPAINPGWRAGPGTSPQNEPGASKPASGP